jgi:hypothetical protein
VRFGYSLYVSIRGSKFSVFVEDILWYLGVGWSTLVSYFNEKILMLRTLLLAAFCFLVGCYSVDIVVNDDVQGFEVLDANQISHTVRLDVGKLSFGGNFIDQVGGIDEGFTPINPSDDVFVFDFIDDSRQLLGRGLIRRGKADALEVRASSLELSGTVTLADGSLVPLSASSEQLVVLDIQTKGDTRKTIVLDLRTLLSGIDFESLGANGNPIQINQTTLQSNLALSLRFEF